MHASNSKARGAIPALISSAIVIGSLLPCGEAVAQSWPVRVHATYKIKFNGINIGKFSFLSRSDKSGYHVTSSTKLRAFFGAFRWKATSQGTGKLGRLQPRPATYSFTYRSKSKRASMTMKFRGRTVASLISVPPAGKSSKRVPIKPKHLKGVFDPLSAVIALTRARPANHGFNPCRQTLAVFDGIQRFDLVLTYLRRVRIPATRSGEAAARSYVCRVRYVPIAGYKRDSRTTRYVARATGIEVVLRPVPAANVFVPYKITVPTGIGSATVISKRVEITTSERRQIALVH